MKVGFLGFGEVASNLSGGLKENGADIYTCVRGRSSRTKNLAEEVGANLCRSNVDVALVSDILISAVVPSKAVEIAQEVGKYCKGVYVDMNNVSPQTVKEALGFIENKNVVDASIMGGVRRKVLKVPILACGESAPYFKELNHYGMNIKIIGKDIGQASAIKMLRSAYTKGVAALLFESLSSAYEMGVDKVLIDELVQTEGPEFRESAISRITGSVFHSERKAQEMEEVLKVISQHSDPLMSRATAEFFRSLSKKTGKLEKRPENYTDVFRMVYGD
jgi:3-hydroxyisobutyrate dehydrogenase-like beta-hydroxyacid dehydrogenase